jgi:2-C-methyl-D-erythritol 4-phosphate cytidylyltransferase
MGGTAQATALIAAAGTGQRLGADGPKAYVEVAGRRLVEWSLGAFAASSSVGAVVVAVPEGHVGEAVWEGVTVLAGGPTRSESVAKGLAEVGSEIVVVHDAARPLVTPELIDAVVGELGDRPDVAGVIAAAPLTDTVKEAGEDGLVERTLDRSRLWAVQTPQAFRTEALREAHASGDLESATDDAMLVERAGGRVALHEAPRENLKVTTPLDLRLAELILAAR